MQECWLFGIISVLILFLAVLIGFFLAKITREELKQGRIWFKILIFACLMAVIILTLLPLENEIKMSSILSLFFIIIATSVSLVKSYDKKFVRGK